MMGLPDSPSSALSPRALRQEVPKPDHVPRVFKFSDYSLETVRTMPEKDYCGEHQRFAALCGMADKTIGQAGEGQEHTYRGIKRSCHRPVCSVCGSDVIDARAKELKDKLLAVKTEYYKGGVELDYKDRKTRKSCYAVELILSPPSSEYSKYRTLEGFRHMYRTVQEFARQIGLIGGFAFMHGVRGENEIIEDYMAGKVELSFSPHYHFIGFMPNRHLINSDVFEKSTGWVYKVVPKWNWGRTKRTFRKKLAYEMDHAVVASYTMIKTDKHDIEYEYTQHTQLDRHVGILHHSSVKKVETYEPEKCKCRGCDHHVYVWDLEMDMRADEPNQVLKERLFILRPGALDRAVNRYGLKVGLVRHEDLSGVLSN